MENVLLAAFPESSFTSDCELEASLSKPPKQLHGCVRLIKSFGNKSGVEWSLRKLFEYCEFLLQAFGKCGKTVTC